MSYLLHRLLGRTYRAEADDNDTGAEDRGDNFVSDEDDTDQLAAAMAAAEADALKKAEDEAAKKADEEAAVTPKKDADDKDEDKKDDEGVKKPEDKEVRIPKARLDEVTRRAKERAEADAKRIADLESRIGSAKETASLTEIDEKIATLEVEYAKHLADGDIDKASASMRQIRMLERSVVSSQAAAIGQNAKEAAKEELRMDAIVADLEAKYPVINPDADGYDADVAKDILDLQDALIARGERPAKALERAAKLTFLERGITQANTKGGAPEKETPKDDDKTAELKAAERKVAQLKKNLEANKQQPAPLKALGVDSDKAGGGLTEKKVSELTMEEFDALPESTKARMRGDIAA